MFALFVYLYESAALCYEERKVLKWSLKKKEKRLIIKFHSKQTVFNHPIKKLCVILPVPSLSHLIDTVKVFFICIIHPWFPCPGSVV